MIRTITTIPATRPFGGEATGGELSQAVKRVAAYARVSTDLEEQQSSYHTQVDYYTRHITDHAGWQLAGVYTDEGITGTSTKHREGFKQMITDALAGKIDLIITKSVSRFARNTVDTLTHVRQLKDHGVEVYFEKENIWTFDSKGELLITIMSSLAQEESAPSPRTSRGGTVNALLTGKSWCPTSLCLATRKARTATLPSTKNEPL